jgi:hypothetical protein
MPQLHDEYGFVFDGSRNRRVIGLSAWASPGPRWRKMEGAWTWSGFRWVLWFSDGFAVREAVSLAGVLVLEALSRVRDKYLVDAIDAAETIGLSRPYNVEDTVELADELMLDALTRIRDKLMPDVLDTTEAIGLSKPFSVEDSFAIADELLLLAATRIQQKVMADSLNLSETISLLKKISHSVQESVSLSDVLQKTAIARNKNKMMVDVLPVSETITLLKARLLSVQEVVSLADGMSRTAESRAKNKTMADSLAVSETISLTVDTITPTIAGCSAHEDAFCTSHVQFTTGPVCASVKVYYAKNNGSWVHVETFNTSPNTFYSGASTGGFSAGDLVEWRVEPFSGANAGGSAGASCYTTQITMGCLP